MEKCECKQEKSIKRILKILEGNGNKGLKKEFEDFKLETKLKHKENENNIGKMLEEWKEYKSWKTWAIRVVIAALLLGLGYEIGLG